MYDYIKKKTLVLLAMLLFQFLATTNVTAVEIKSTETNGSIEFSGVYEPIGKPDPTPPESMVIPPIIEVAKPDGMLPQTNDLTHSFLTWFGVIIIAICWKRKKYQKYNNKKAGIIK
ncbi:LPXTG cell wall anchor domain-containing protein [Enterococcus casseliflavus]|uniref:LPXTG cell wall anchor domain-containing protein n=1 Tax=Enterococcus casseliflavus TaxID=37734 RepID=UPI002DBFA0C5|nr:LPXTG cell wall anchor domain-containing protein [Enterococcus casseliflavus]MEB8401536.1 LPXTG cell wall anchor domain-containing protein [Enterococcus casseliflavus]